MWLCKCFQQRPLPVIEQNIEGAFLTRESYETLLDGDFLKVPIMVGTTSEEDIYSVTGTFLFNIF